MSEGQLRQSIIDQEHLRLLSIGYTVSASTNVLFSVFGLLYMFMGVFLTTLVSHMPGRPGQDLPPEFIGMFFGVIGFSIFAIMLGFAALKFLAARRLKQRRSRTFCYIVAIITCFSVPFGTILGVCTFLVLSRPSVTQLFQR